MYSFYTIIWLQHFILSTTIYQFNYDNFGLFSLVYKHTHTLIDV